MSISPLTASGIDPTGGSRTTLSGSPPIVPIGVEEISTAVGKVAYRVLLVVIDEVRYVIQGVVQPVAGAVRPAGLCPRGDGRGEGVSAEPRLVAELSYGGLIHGMPSQVFYRGP